MNRVSDEEKISKFVNDFMEYWVNCTVPGNVKNIRTDWDSEAAIKNQEKHFKRYCKSFGMSEGVMHTAYLSMFRCPVGVRDDILLTENLLRVEYSVIEEHVKVLEQRREREQRTQTVLAVSRACYDSCTFEKSNTPFPPHYWAMRYEVQERGKSLLEEIAAQR